MLIGVIVLLGQSCWINQKYFTRTNWNRNNFVFDFAGRLHVWCCRSFGHKGMSSLTLRYFISWISVFNCFLFYLSNSNFKRLAGLLDDTSNRFCAQKCQIYVIKVIWFERLEPVTMQGCFIIIFAVLCWCFYFVMDRSISKVQSLPPTSIFQCFVARSLSW